MFKNSLLFFLIVFFILSSSLAISQEVVVPIEENELCPYSGIIFSHDAAVKLFSEIELSEKMCLLEKEAIIKESKNNCKLLTTSLTVDLESEREKNRLVLEELQEAYELLDTSSLGFDWEAGLAGVGLGAAITTIGFIIYEIGR